MDLVTCIYISMKTEKCEESFRKHRKEQNINMV